MKRNLQLIAVLCACAIFLLTGCQSSKTFSPSADSTWGQLCKQLQPEWYDSLPDEVSAQLDSLLLSEDHSSASEDPNPSSVTPVYKEVEQSKDAGYTILGQDNGECIAEDKTVRPTGMSLLLNEQDRAVDYILSAYTSIEEEPTQVSIIIAISDAKTGAYLAAAADTIPITDDIDGVVESFQNLKHDHKYTVQALVILTPPQGYQSSGPLYVEKEVTTKEPTTK